jgi:hypothetical protein
MSEQSECPLNKSKTNDKGRYDPKNMAVALAYQLHDDVRTFYAMAYSGNTDSIEYALNAIQAKIEHFRNSGKARWVHEVKP